MEISSDLLSQLGVRRNNRGVVFGKQSNGSWCVEFAYEWPLYKVLHDGTHFLGRLSVLSGKTRTDILGNRYKVF